jgi:hypothetical protein
MVVILESCGEGETMPNIAGQRLYNQRLEGPKFQRPDEVVAWLGAVQAQEYALAKWALGLRMEHATDDVIEQAFTDGLILRTHVMRPTWHFVTPVDIRWMLELTAPRVHAVNAYQYRKMELDDALLQRSSDTIASALEGGRYLTRAELSAVLADTGVDTTNGIRLGYILQSWKALYATGRGAASSIPMRCWTSACHRPEGWRVTRRWVNSPCGSLQVMARQR